MTVGLILVAGVALITTLVLLDAIRLPFFQKSAMAASTTKSKDHGNDIPIPVSARPISIYTAVQQADLTDLQTKTIKFTWVDPDKAKEYGFFTKYNDVVGRVLKRDKAVGLAFSEADFYPKGAQPTPANAIEEGKLGMYIDPSKIDGLGELKRGDTFDLMAVKAGVKDLDGKNNGPVVSGIVTGAKVIMALPPPPPGKTSKSGEQMYIQITPQEMVDLRAALATNAHLSCATRPGMAGVQTPRLPIPTPEPAPDVIEIVSGRSGSRKETLPSNTPVAEESATPGSGKPAQPAEPEPKKKSSSFGEK